MSTPPFPARLHVLLARDAPVGLVIRRGPSKRVCTIGWDRQNDTFTVGQWLKGRIGEGESDLSPDGKHFVYCAMNRKQRSETGGAWTAVSRTPHLKAIGLWQSSVCWRSGGLFLTNNQLWIDTNAPILLTPPADLSTTASLRSCSPLVEHAKQFEQTYHLRLARDGWKYRETLRHKDDVCSRFVKGDITEIFSKDIPHGWALQKYGHIAQNHPPGKRIYYEEHELIHKASDATIDMRKAEWADLDRDRLVWAEDGKLYAAGINEKGLEDRTELYDFNQMTFEALEAPY